MFYWLVFIVGCVSSLFVNAASSELSECYQGSWQGDPASVVENVSTIRGDYTEIEVDLIAASPDPLVISRFYSSQDSPEVAVFGGWRFNPQCFLNLEDDRYAYVGNPDGSILTYIRSEQEASFTIDIGSLSNNSTGGIRPWTNAKNNQLYFDPSKDSFELLLCSQGKRFYVKHSENRYVMTHEILPSGNKIFYEYDKEGRLEFIKQMNSSESKVLAWIKIRYGTEIGVESSDGKTVRYCFAQGECLTEVVRSHKPCLKYEYQIVDGKSLLSKKILPEGRFVQVEYAKDKVIFVMTPLSMTQFSYGDGWTEVTASGNRKSIHRFNPQKYLVAIEQYLDNSLYRVYKKSWLSGNLISTSIEDRQGGLLYHKCWHYDRGNIVLEQEYGDIAGNGAIPLLLNLQGEVTNQEAHVTRYSYFSDKDTYGVFQGDEKGGGVKCWYKKGTNLLLKKLLLTRGSEGDEIRERHFYTYNEDGMLTRLVVDDAKSVGVADCAGMTQRLITDISFDVALEVIEQKYAVANGKNEVLFKKTENRLDAEGNIVSQAIYDAHGEFQYSIAKKYKSGLLICEMDPLGHETCYSYDANRNLVQVTRSNTAVVTEYCYNLHNRLVSTSEYDGKGHRFESSVAYDAAGYKSAEIDRFGNQTLMVNDSLGRPIQITYSIQGKTYRYDYDLFDHLTCVIDPEGHRLKQTFNLQGKIAEVEHLDGTCESFRYDSAGNLHYYRDQAGVLQAFEYDWKGRPSRVSYHERGLDGFGDLFKQEVFTYNAFHQTSERDARGHKTFYSYDGAGRLTSLKKKNQKIDFFYDSMGRVEGVKKWQSDENFTLEKKEYDLLDRVIQEWIEDAKGKILAKKRFVYNEAGQLAQVIGYPHNKESVLFCYEYDSFSRMVKSVDAAGRQTQILYDDTYTNDEGQRRLKRVVIDPSGARVEELFDTENRLIKTTQIDAAGKLLNSTCTSYDLQGYKCLEETGSNKTQWSFNERGQLESLKLSNRLPVRFTYHPSGQLASRFNLGSEAPITYAYDQKGELTTVSYKEGDCDIFVDLVYDHHHNLISMTRPGLSTRRTYNPQNLPLSEIIQDEFGSYGVKVIYDGAGNVDTIELPDGTLMQYAYQGPFVKGVFRSDSDEEEDFYSHYIDHRDQMGNILQETLPEGLGKRTQTWDKAGRRMEIVTNFSYDRIPEGGYDLLDQITMRITRCGQQVDTTHYEYDSAFRLISEKSSADYSYVYEAAGNRLQKNGSGYILNDCDELQEAEGTSYTYDARGNLATKTINGETWIFHSNPLNQLTSIQAPNGTITTFTYDLTGRRLSKRIDIPGKKPKILRFFYLGDTEIGAIDEKGVIIQLKVPGNPNNPEEPCIAIEIQNQFYVPQYDLVGNVIGLVDPLKRTVVESYRYSAYGEEEIFDKQGNFISGTLVGNPWRYRGKRIEKQAGLIFFGKRYYDPKIGRWTSPDPAGTIDGPNLYAFVHNNPLKYVDYFGLVSEIAENCGCTKHDHPGWQNAPPGCVCICGDSRVAMDLAHYKRVVGSALEGIGHGVVDFVASSLQDLQTCAAYIGSSDLEICVDERMHLIEAVEVSQVVQRDALGRALRDMMSIDESDAVYQACRSMTTTGLAVGSVMAGGYGAVKGVIAFNRLAKIPTRLAKISSQLKWPSPAKGRSIVNEIEYTTHALERMAPRGLIQNGTEIISRGVPPSVVDNAIKFGTKTVGNTSKEIVHVFENVRVVTNLDATIVITVITTGK